jgi:hypothetical protein
MRPRRQEITTSLIQPFDGEFRTFYCSPNVNCDAHIKYETYERVACMNNRKLKMWRAGNTWNGDTSKEPSWNGTWRYGNDSKWIGRESSSGSCKILWRLQVPKKRGINEELCDYQLFKNKPALTIRFFRVIYYMSNKKVLPLPLHRSPSVTCEQVISFWQIPFRCVVISVYLYTSV